MAETESFTYTGDAETFTVPRHVAGTLRVELRGGDGGSYGSTALAFHGGEGGEIEGALDVAAGSTIYVVVGGDGGDGTPGGAGGSGGGPALGGQGGTSHATSSGGGGGGAATEIRVGGSTVADRVMVAGGGGGGGIKGFLSSTDWHGGNGGMGHASGGAAFGTISDGGTARWSGAHGTPGTLAAAGSGGVAATRLTDELSYTNVAGQNGAAGVGGDSGTDSDYGNGGGGGGGYYGAGAGGGGIVTGSNGSGGGGGGSSWADSLVVSDVGDSVSLSAAGVKFTWEPAPGGWKVGTL